MPDRRSFLKMATAGAAAPFAAARPAPATMSGPIRAVALDGLAVFDTRPIAVLSERLFPGRGAELGKAWRTRQFEYTWLRTMSGRYAGFEQVTREALVFAARALALDLDAAKRDTLMEAYLHIEAWPDAALALTALKDKGIALAVVSNFTARLLGSAVANSRMAGLFDHLLSTDRVRAYKPDPRAYRMALDAFDLPAAQIAFAAFGGWDAAGAKAFGHPTFWVNRAQAPLEELADKPDASGNDLRDLIAFVAALT